MSKIIDELWRGNIDPSTKCRELTGESKELMGYIARHHDDLRTTLTDDQKTILEKLDDCCVELTEINERRIFSYAFRLGARLAMEMGGETLDV